MRQFDSRLRAYATDLCSLVPDSADTDAIEERLDDLEALGDNWSAHISSKVVHGTTSNVVGLSDAQFLDNKTIGKTGPGYGRFTHVIQSNVIPLGDDLVVPVSHNMVNAGVYSVYGTLTVAGTACFIDVLTDDYTFNGTFRVVGNFEVVGTATFS
jgi:hypothetical protein